MSRIINAHEHAWTTPDAQPWVSDLTPFGVRQLVYDIDNVREDMTEYGIDQTVLIAPPIHGRGSPYTRECLRRYPDEFYGILLLDYFADDIAARVDAAFSQENVLGFRFGAVMRWGTMWQERTASADWFTDPELEPFWDALERYDTPHVQLLLEPPQLPAVEELIAAHPNVTFVLDHLADPDPSQHPPDGSPYTQLKSIAGHSNVYMKITRTPSREPYPFADIHGHIRNLFDWFGSERLLWGTDWVYHLKETTPWETIHFLEELPFVSQSDRRDLQYRTFKRLLPA